MLDSRTKGCLKQTMVSICFKTAEFTQTHTYSNLSYMEVRTCSGLSAVTPMGMEGIDQPHTCKPLKTSVSTNRLKKKYHPQNGKNTYNKYIFSSISIYTYP